MRIPLLYKIGTVLLSVFAYLILISMLLNVVKAGFQPIMLIVFFISSGVAIYITLCFKLNNIVNQQHTLPDRTRDWIKVNGFVGLVFALLMILGCANFLSNPSIMDTILNNAYKEVSGDMQEINFREILRAVIITLLIYSILLIIHIISSLVYVGKYSKLFQNKPNTL